MTGPKQLVCEEPIRPNPHLPALDEQSGTLVLAEFSVDSAYRYSLIWERPAHSFEIEALQSVASVARLLSLRAHLVVAWKHDPTGHLRIRHRQLQSYLARAGWRSEAGDGIGVAILTTTPDDLAVASKAIVDRDVGWFVALGEWVSVDTLLKAPFRDTMMMFAWNHHISPSVEFIRGVASYAGAIAFAESSDDRAPAVRVVTSHPVAAEMRGVFDIDEL